MSRLAHVRCLSHVVLCIPLTKAPCRTPRGVSSCLVMSCGLSLPRRFESVTFLTHIDNLAASHQLSSSFLSRRRQHSQKASSNRRAGLFQVDTNLRSTLCDARSRSPNTHGSALSTPHFYVKTICSSTKDRLMRHATLLAAARGGVCRCDRRVI